MRLLLIAVALLTLTAALSPDSSQASQLPAGVQLTEAQKEELHVEACRIFRPDLLPDGVRPQESRAICGTPVLAMLAANWQQLSKKTQDAFLFLWDRPVMQREVSTDTGHFLIHYDVAGVDAVDLSDSNRNGVPDYVDDVSETLGYVWDLLMRDHGYAPPLSDGDSLYDVYIVNMATDNFYGMTYPETPGLVTSSFVKIDNNYTDAIYATRGLDGLHVTVAHEFYHAVQFGYYADIGTSIWWHEATATWMEDVAYDEVNDYYQYLDSFFSSPHVALDHYGEHIYGASVFAHYLSNLYGVDAIRATWEVLKHRPPQDSRLIHFDDAMPSGGFSQVFPTFVLWNYYTGSRTRAGYYEEASFCPLADSRVLLPDTGKPVTGSAQVDHLGAVYLRVPTRGIHRGLSATLALDPDAVWELSVLLHTPNRVEVLRPIDPSRVTLRDIGRYEEVVLIPMVTSLEDEWHRLEYTVAVDPGVSEDSDLVGDFDRNGHVSFANFVFFAGGYGAKPASPGYRRQRDLNGDGKIDFADFLIFASHFGES